MRLPEVVKCWKTGFAIQPNWEKLMGVWACGCLRNWEEEKAEMDRWKEERLQNIGLNIKNTRLTAPVDHLLIHRISVRVCVCVSVHMCQYSQSHQKLDDSIMQTTIPSVVGPHSHSLLCPQKRMSSFLRRSFTLFFSSQSQKNNKTTTDSVDSA